MGRSRWGMGLLAATTLIALNCGDWHTYDDMFARTTPLAGARGWSGGDGAFGIRLPGGTDRTLWLFGDSLVTSIDANGNRVADKDLPNVTFGNTIAIQDNSTSPAPDQIHFYARTPGTDCNLVPTRRIVPACPVTDITRISNDYALGFTQFFNHKLLNLDPLPSGAGFLWPTGAVCLNCDAGDTTDDKLLVSFDEWQPCDPSKDANCAARCAFTGADSGTACTGGVRMLGSVLARVENPTAALSNWSVHSMRYPAGTMAWNSFMQDGSTLYIYGSRPNKNKVINLAKAEKNQLVLAAVNVGSELDLTQWTYRIGGKYVHYSTPPAPSTLDKVAYVAGIPSITKLVRGGKTQFLLLHDNPFIDHFVYARVSSSLATWDDVTTTTPRAEISAFEKTLSDQLWIRPIYGYCSLPAAPNDYRTCGLNYHALAHPHLSFSDGDGISALMFSYIIPQSLLPDGASSADVYRPKFGALPIDSLSPWCTTPNQCWAGIAFQYTTASIAKGSNSNVTSYDVSKASGTRLNVSLVGGTGDPDVYVRFGSPPTTADWDCRPYGTTFPETCDIPITGQTTAYVMVRGYSDATYTLRVHYAGE
jgi:hypothetical protein